MKGGARPGAGRRKGTKNKATEDVKKLIDENVDFNMIIQGLYKLAKGGDTYAAKTLLEYRYGKPKQPVEGDFDGNLTIKIVRE